MTLIYWDITIAFYLFSAGVSAGALMVSIAADIIGKGKYGRIIKYGAWIAPFPVSVGTLALIFDLERPFHFWRLLLSFEPTSVMSIGAWILIAFTLVSMVFFYPYIPEKVDVMRIRRRVSKIGAMTAVKIAGLILALATALYTGVLLNSLSARPFWDTLVLPLVFLFSAIIDGIAAILLLMFVLPQPDTERTELAAGKSFLGKLDLASLILLIVSMLIMLLDLNFSGGQTSRSLSVIMGGSLTLIFWLGVVVIGMLAPLSYDIVEIFKKHAAEEKERDRLIAMLIAASVLAGGFMLRYVMVYAGQLTGIVIT
jgi:formate-dependent nitrite reductase membrane component NrfD